MSCSAPALSLPRRSNSQSVTCDQTKHAGKGAQHAELHSGRKLRLYSFSMKRVVVRPRIQIPLLVMVFTIWTCIGATYFTSGDVLAKRDWFGIVLGFVSVLMGICGIWRALRLGVVIDDNGVRLRHFDSRDHLVPWSSVRSVECAQIDERLGLPLYGPILELGDGSGVLPIRALGSCSRQDAERKADRLRAFIISDGPT